MSGQPITMRGGHAPYIAIDQDGHFHLLLSPAAADPARLARFRRPALELANRPWVVSGGPVAEYLDVTLIAPAASPLRRLFLSFCEDMLIDVERGASPESAAYRTCSRWQRFWEDTGTEVPSVTWVLGLLGELVVLESLLNLGGSEAVLSWVGPDGADHDFQAGTAAALEVKTSVEMPAVVECGLAQLDSGGTGELLLAVLHAMRREGAITLPDVVERLEGRLAADEEALDSFLTKIGRVGYRRHLAAEYAAHAFELAPAAFHHVAGDFPRITQASFAHPLDNRVREVRYRLELSGLEPLAEDDPRLVAALRLLARV